MHCAHHYQLPPFHRALMLECNHRHVAASVYYLAIELNMYTSASMQMHVVRHHLEWLQLCSSMCFRSHLSSQHRSHLIFFALFCCCCSLHCFGCYSLLSLSPSVSVLSIILVVAALSLAISIATSLNHHTPFVAIMLRV